MSEGGGEEGGDRGEGAVEVGVVGCCGFAGRLGLVVAVCFRGVGHGHIAVGGGRTALRLRGLGLRGWVKELGAINVAGDHGDLVDLVEGEVGIDEN